MARSKNFVIVTVFAMNLISWTQFTKNAYCANSTLIALQLSYGYTSLFAGAFRVTMFPFVSFLQIGPLLKSRKAFVNFPSVKEGV